MGFFSWTTSDSNESIANVHASHENARRAVYFLQPNGEPSIREDSYDGFGIFGGVDVYDWLARKNATASELDSSPSCELRDIGIGLDCGSLVRDLTFPLKFSFDENAVYEELPAAEHCPHQGCMYH